MSIITAMPEDAEPKKTRIFELPYCPNRVGKFRDGRLSLACGCRDVEPEECMNCETALKRLNP